MLDHQNNYVGPKLIARMSKLFAALSSTFCIIILMVYHYFQISI